MGFDQWTTGLRINGFCVIPDVIPATACAQIAQRILAAVERGGDRNTAAEGVGFLNGLINHDQSFAPYLADERILRLSEFLLGQHVRISFTSAIVNLPGHGRGEWHADWPFNQKNAGHIRAPYPDVAMHVTTLWMITPFTTENGGTLVAPGSHRAGTNPTAGIGVDPLAPFPGEMNATGPAGSVLFLDSRLWHATPPNTTDRPRVALAVRYAPWWLNCEILRPGSVERRRMVDEPGLTDNVVPPVFRHVFDALPDPVKPLYRHWVID